MKGTFKKLEKQINIKKAIDTISEPFIPCAMLIKMCLKTL